MCYFNILQSHRRNCSTVLTKQSPEVKFSQSKIILLLSIGTTKTFQLPWNENDDNHFMCHTPVNSWILLLPNMCIYFVCMISNHNPKHQVFSVLCVISHFNYQIENITGFNQLQNWLNHNAYETPKLNSKFVDMKQIWSLREFMLIPFGWRTSKQKALRICGWLCFMVSLFFDKSNKIFHRHFVKFLYDSVIIVNTVKFR